MIPQLSKIPALVVITLLALAFAGLHYDSHQTIKSLVCTSLKAKKNKAAADVLFIGTSVVGRSIDPFYISTKLEEYSGQPVSVETLAPVKSYTPRFLALVHDYIKFRGSPEIVVLNLPYSRFGANAVADTRMLWKIPYTASTDSLLETGKSIFKSLDLDLTSTEMAFHRDGVNYFRLQLEKLAVNIYGGLRYPILALTNQRRACPAHMLEPNNFMWAANQGSDKPSPLKKTKSQLKIRESRYRAMMNRPPADPSLKVREFESNQIKSTINLLVDSGSTVYITTIPRYKETKIDESLIAKYHVAFENAHYINLYSELTENQMESFQQSFNDGVHVDHYGAFVMSQFWVDRLENLSSD